MRRVAAPLVALLLVVSTAMAQDARGILQATGVKGGLLVVIGCDDPNLLAGLRASEAFLVRGLDTDPQKVERARQQLNARGLYGKVSVARFDGRTLPFVEDVVNLVVASDLGQVAMAEVMRVLAPRGVAYIRDGATWRKSIKPVPRENDEWSHFLHDASGNAVSRDPRIGPPKRLRWVAGPRWCRSHEFPSSVMGVVTAKGRIFTLIDEAPPGIYEKLPQRCTLVARDAANGLLLWKKPLGRDWQPQFGTGKGNRWQIHHTIPRRIVTDGERVFVTLGFLDSPVSVLDAATGKVLIKALPGTTGADELLLSEGILIAKATKGRSVGAMVRLTKEALHDALAAVDAASGKLLWRKEKVRVIPYCLCAADGRVVYHDMDAVVCLDARTGRQVWRAPLAVRSALGASSNLVIADGVVLFHGNTNPQAAKPTGKRARSRLYLTALSLRDGKVLWGKAGGRGWAAACVQPTDLFVASGVVWLGGSFQGLDLRTGQVKKTVEVGKTISPGHHYRCYRSKATVRYLILPKRGTEFIDISGKAHMRNDWVRGPCFTGHTPANGLLYSPSNQCFCYPGVKVPGYLALSAERPEPLKPATEANLERGPAFGKIEPAAPGPADWPMYRRDPQRSGATKLHLPTRFTAKWEVRLACQPTQAIVVGGRLWVVEKDAHRLRCLDAASGKPIWAFTAAGRIDSPPTYHDGTLLFGCRDGSVYCLRASDGAVAWRFRAAPRPRLTVAYEHLESLWPVSGSVLVQDGVVYFAAGRSSFLDGGIIVYGLDARTGKPLYHHILEGPWPDVWKDTGAPFAMEGALPDLLVSDGKNLYMRRIKFDPKLNRLPVKRGSSLGELDMGAIHLTATGGFLDDTGFDRLYWTHSRWWPGFYFSQHASKSGQLIVFDDQVTYAVKYFYRRTMWSPKFYPGEKGYLLFADDRDNEPALLPRGKREPDLKWLPPESYKDKYRRGGIGVEKGTGFVRVKPARWQRFIPVRVRAMVLAGEKLIVAGPPDIVDPKDPLAALEGRKGSVLMVLSAADGRPLAQQRLGCLPAFDAMSAAAGRLYLATHDGRLICFGGQ